MTRDHQQTILARVRILVCGGVVVLLGAGCGVAASHHAIPARDVEPLERAAASASVAAARSAVVAAPLNLRVTWPASVDDEWVTNYRVGYGHAPGRYTNQADFGRAVTGVMSNLPRGKRFYLAVQAQNAAGVSGPWSREFVWPPIVTNILRQWGGKPITNFTQ